MGGVKCAQPSNVEIIVDKLIPVLLTGLMAYQEQRKREHTERMEQMKQEHTERNQKHTERMEQMKREHTERMTLAYVCCFALVYFCLFAGTKESEL